MSSKPSVPPAPAHPHIPLPPQPPVTSDVSYAIYSPTPSEIEVYKRKRQIITHWRTELEGSNEELSYAQGRGVGSADWSLVGSSDSGTVPTTIIDQTLSTHEKRSQFPLHSPTYQPLRSPPIPLLARSPPHPRSISNPNLSKPIPLAPGDVLYPPPASNSSHSQREAYISSALDLPIDILRQTNDGNLQPLAPSGRLGNGRGGSMVGKGGVKMTPAEKANGDRVEILRDGLPSLARSKTVGGVNITGDGSDRLQSRGVKTQPHAITSLKTPINAQAKTTRTVSAPVPPSRINAKDGLNPRKSIPPKAPLNTPLSAQHYTEVETLPVQYLTPVYKPTEPVRALGSQQSQRSQESRQRRVSGEPAVRSLGSQQSQESARREQPEDKGVRAVSSQGSQQNQRAVRRQASDDMAVRSMGSQQSQRSQQSQYEDIAMERTSQSTKVAPRLAVPSMGSGTSHRSTNRSFPAQPPSRPVAPPPTPQNEIPYQPIETEGLPISPLKPVSQLVPPHRQQLPLPRPALARSASSFDALGRRLRDVSTTSLTARFEPNMYPLPPSHTTGEMTSPEVISLPLLPQEQIQYSQPIGIPAPSINLAGNTVIYANKSQVNIGANTEQAPASSTSHVPETQQIPRPSATHHDEGAYPIPAHHSAHAAPNPPSFYDNHLETKAPSPPPPPALYSRSIRPPPPQSPEHVHITANPDEDHLTFEVPSGSRGRLRVSLAWLRDGTTGNAERARRRRSTSPPPVPPKSPRPFFSRLRDSFTPQMRRDHRPPRPLPPKKTSSPPSPPSSRSSLPYLAPSRTQEPSRPSLSNNLGFQPAPFYPNAIATVYPHYPPGQPIYNMAAPSSGILPPFVYPQPVMPSWPPQQNQARPRPSVRFPASPTRAPSIDPPSTRSSPGGAPIPLPPAQSILGGAYPQPGPSNIPLNNLLTPHSATILTASRNDNPYRFQQQQQRSVWKRLAGRGGDNRGYGYGGGAGDVRDLETSRVGNWRKNVPFGRAPTVAPTIRVDRTRETRERSGLLGRMLGQTRERRFGQGYYDGLSPRKKQADGYSPEVPLPGTYGPSMSRRDQRPPPIPMKNVIPPRIPIYDPSRQAREREKEMMRRMKAERRDARDARRSRSAATRSGDDLPGTIVRNEGKRPERGRSEGMVRDWVGRFGGGDTGVDGKRKLWKQRVRVEDRRQGGGEVRSGGRLMGLLIGNR